MDKILIIDDNVFNLEMLRGILNEKYEVVTINQGIKAFKTIEEYQPDLILLDILMPDIDGFLVCKKIKQNPDFAEIPIIFITAKDDIDDIIKGFEYGGQDYVTRPFYSEELIERIKTHIELKKSKEMLKKCARDLEEKNEELLHMTRTDYMTGILNRGYMMELLKEKINRTESSGQHFSIIICDIDHFKKINDTHGHEYGDQVIKSVTEKISAVLEKGQLIARWGGEEFLILLSGADKEKAFELSEKIRKEVEKSEFDLKGYNIKLTITLGIKEYEHGFTIEENIANADEALYKGKRDGRNMSVLY